MASRKWPSFLIPMTTPTSATMMPLSNGERSEEHTSELQSRLHLVCRLLLEKKTKTSHIREPANRRTPTALPSFPIASIAVSVDPCGSCLSLPVESLNAALLYASLYLTPTIV